MKQLLYILILIISFSPQFASGFDVAKDVEENWEEQYSDDPADRRVYDVKIDETLESRGELDTEEESHKLKEENILRVMFDENRYQELIEKQNSIQFFQPFFEFTDDQLYCPPLLEQYKSSHFSLIESKDYLSGSITCSVVENPLSIGFDESYREINKKEMKRVYKYTFQNKNIRDYNEWAIKNLKVDNVIEDDAILAEELNQENLDFLKQNIKQRYSIATGVTEDEQYSLSLSRMIDNLLIFNNGVIDLQATIDQNRIVPQAGYNLMYNNEELIEKENENLKTLRHFEQGINDQYNFDLNIFEQQKNTPTLVSEIEQLLGNHYIPLVKFILQYQDYLNDLFYAFLVGAIAFFSSNMLKKYAENTQVLKEKTKQIAIYTAIFLSLFYVLDDSELNKFTINSKEYSLNTNMFQNLLFTHADSMSELTDNITRATFENYTDSMFSNNLLNIHQIHTIGRSYLMSLEQKEKYEKDIATCRKTFNLDVLKLENEEWFYNNDYLINPFVPEEIAEKSRQLSVYNNINNGGYTYQNINVRNTEYALDGCFNIQNKLKYLLQQITYQKLQIDNFNDLEMKQKYFTKKELFVEEIYINLIKYGYLAAPLLHEKHGFLKLDELISKKREEYTNYVTDLNLEKSVNFFSSNLFAYYMFGGQEVFKTTSSFFEITTSIVGFFSTSLQKGLSNTGGLITSFIYVDLLEEVLILSKYLLVSIMGYLQLLVIFVYKFLSFFLVSYWLIFIFLANSTEKVASVSIKVLILWIKPALIVFMSYITLFVLDFTGNFMDLTVMMRGVANNGELWINIANDAYKGIFYVLNIVLSWAIAWFFMMKGSSAVFEFLDTTAHDVTERVINSEQLSQKIIR